MPLRATIPSAIIHLTDAYLALNGWAMRNAKKKTEAEIAQSKPLVAVIEVMSDIEELQKRLRDAMQL